MKNNDISIKFGKHLKTLRQQKNLTQQSIAKMLGVPVSTYANWEQGRREPRLFDYLNMIYVLNMDISDFFDIFN